MKKQILLILILIMSLNKLSGQIRQTLNINGTSYSFDSKIEDNSMKISFYPTNKSSDVKHFNLSPFTLESFRNSLVNELKSTLPADSTKRVADSTLIVENARDLYLSLAMNEFLNNKNEKPIAGKLLLAKEVDVFEDWTKKNKIGSFNILSADLEVKDGYIEQIKVKGNYKALNSSNAPNDIRFFDANYPIGISTRKNIEGFADRQLFDRMHEENWIKLSDLFLYYDYSVSANTRDLSPGNAVYKGITPSEEAIFHRTETEKLFEAKIYTDFLGIKDQNANGILQFEISKRINTKTNLHMTYPAYQAFSTCYGLFQFVQPYFNFNKIENKNRDLSLDYKYKIVNNTAIKNNAFGNATSVLNHQSFTTGILSNLFSLKNYDTKFDLDINIGVSAGLTQTSDSILVLNNDRKLVTGNVVNKTNLLFTNWYPEILLSFWPEERFSFNVRFREYHLNYYSNTIEPSLISKMKSGQPTEAGNKVISFQLETQIKVNENGKTFARFNLNSLKHEKFSNFYQVQLGYTFYPLRKV